MDSNKRPENMERITTPALAEAFIEEQLEAPFCLQSARVGLLAALR